jgi:hypothetical protein
MENIFTSLSNFTAHLNSGETTDFNLEDLLRTNSVISCILCYKICGKIKGITATSGFVAVHPTAINFTADR